MKKYLSWLTVVYPSPKNFNLSMLIFRVILSLELIVVHGLKKVGIGVEQAELVPNPYHFAVGLNNFLAISANLFFPALVIFGFLTRLAIIPILAVTLSGYFVMHWNDSLLVKDVPFMYSLSYLFLLFIGPGKYSIDNSINKRR